MVSINNDTNDGDSERIQTDYILFEDDEIDMSSPLYNYQSPPPPKFPSIVVIPGPFWLAAIFLLGLFTILLFTVKPMQEKILVEWLKTTKCHVIEVGSLPLISIVFTYVHIWAALFLTFYPIHYRGTCQIPGTNLGIIGWQGIVPNRCVEMAKIAVDLMMQRLINMEEIFSKIDINGIRDKLVGPLQESCEPLIHYIGKKYAPVIWDAFPTAVKRDLIRSVSKSTPDVITKFFYELKQPGFLEECLNVESLVTRKLMKDKDLLNQIFIRCGYNELAFIRDFSAWMGGFFGLVQAIIYIYYDADWVLPVAGLIVGCLTNWIALQMIFRPVNPIYIPICWPKCLAFGCCKRKYNRYNNVCDQHVFRPTCGSRMGLAEITLHGLFLSRQNNVAIEYGRVASEHLLNARSVVEEMFTGDNKDKMFDRIYTHVNDYCDEMIKKISVSFVTPQFILGDAAIEEIKADIIDFTMQQLPIWLCRSEILNVIDISLDCENVLREKLGNLPSSEFESLLHPVFQQDEWKLILMGGLLGVAIGLIQNYFINTGC